MTRTASSAIAVAPSADDLAFLHRAERATRRQSAPAALGRCLHRVSRVRPRLSRYARRTATLLLIIVAATGFAISAAPPAHADILEPNTWCDRKTFNPTRADVGLLGAILAADWRDANNNGTPPTTKWAEYGAQGTEWGTFWLDCLDYRRVVNEAANQVFMLTRAFSSIAILVFMWTFKGDLLNIFLDSNQNIAGSTATLDDMISQVHADVYLQLFSVAALIAAVVLAFRFLFKNAGGSDLLGKFALMVLVAGFALFYGGVPGGGGPHAASVLKTFNDWTNDITSVVLSAFAGTDCETPSIRHNAGDDFGETEAARSRRRDLALQCAAEALYEVTIYTPWAVGELGTYERAPRQPGGARGNPTETEVLAARILTQQTYSFSDIKQNNGDPAHYRDGRASPDSDICRNGGPDARNKATYTGKLCDRALMRQNEFGAGDEQFADASWSWGRVNAGNQLYWENWSGGQAGNRFQVALLALIGSSSIALIIIIVSLTYLVLEIATIMFALMAPVAFLIGLIPGFGTKVLLRWLELLLGTFVKRIVLGLFVGLLMALYSVVLTIDMPWLMKLILVCMIAAMGLIYRKKFTEAFALKFSGSEAFHTDGQLTSGMIGAAVGGAVGSRMAGGSAMGGMAVGVGRRVAPGATSAYYDGALRQAIRAGRPGRSKPYVPPKMPTP